jgi:hypothetical protein
MTVNRPWTYSPTTAVSATAAISADNSYNNSKAPFARASEADRNCLPGYSWPPHLYQETSSIWERTRKSEPNLGSKYISKKLLQLKGLEWDLLGGDEEFAGEGGFGRAAAEGFLGGYAKSVRVVVFLGDMREDEIARDSVETFRISEIFADGVVREVPGTAQHALLHYPRIRTHFQHVEIVVGFENKTVCPAQMHFDMVGDVTEVGANGHLSSVRAKGESDRVDGIVGNTKGMDVDVANGEALTGLDVRHATQTLA